MLIEKLNDRVHRVTEEAIRFHAAGIESGSRIVAYSPIRTRAYKHKVPERCGTDLARWKFKRGKVDQVREAHAGRAVRILELDAEIARLIDERQHEIEMAYYQGKPLTKQQVLELDTKGRQAWAERNKK